MRNCAPGNERAFSLNTVPRIRKSFAWLYFFLFGLFDVASGVCAAGAEEGGDDAGSCVEAIATAREAKSAAVHGTVIHRRRCIGLLLIDLDGESSQEDARREGGCACYSSSASSSSSSSSSRRSPFSPVSSSSSSSSSSKSSEMRFRWTGCVCETSSSDSHSGQLRISPSSTSSSSTSISAEHSGQRITAPSSVLSFAKWGYKDRARHPAAYYIPRWMKSTPVHAGAALNGTAPWHEDLFEWHLQGSIPNGR